MKSIIKDKGKDTMQVQKRKKLETDVISIMPESDLYNLRTKLANQHSNFAEKNDESKIKDIEVELCYLDREIEIRKIRKELHAKWLKENPVEYFEDIKEFEEEENIEDEEFYG